MPRWHYMLLLYYAPMALYVITLLCPDGFTMPRWHYIYYAPMALYYAPMARINFILYFDPINQGTGDRVVWLVLLPRGLRHQDPYSPSSVPLQVLCRRRPQNSRGSLPTSWVVGSSTLHPSPCVETTTACTGPWRQGAGISTRFIVC